MGILANTSIEVKIKVGDIIVLRDGREYEVTEIQIDENDLRLPLKIYWGNTDYWYTPDGFIDSDKDENDEDIVKVIKHTQLG